jgi:predicted PurR-regulated permease PerM
MLETVVGIVALAISAFAVIISIVFYFKSDKLYKEMLKFISEIRVFSERTYTDTFSMVKEAWPQVWRKDEGEKVKQEAQEEKEKIKQDITKDIMAEITKIKETSSKGIQEDQLKTEMSRLEQTLTKAIAEAFRKIEAVDTKKTKMLPLSEDIDRAIIEYLHTEHLGGITAGVLAGIISSKLGIPSSLVFERIVSLTEKTGLFAPQGRRVDFNVILMINQDKLMELMK